MKFVLIYVLAVNIVSFSCSNVEDARNHIVNVGEYEVKFHEIFQTYWQNKRTLTDELRNIVKIPRQSDVKIEEVPDCLAPKKCIICRALAYSTLSHYQNNSVSNIEEYLYDLCTILSGITDIECHGMINIYAPSIKHILKQRANELSSDRICGILFPHNVCSTTKNWIDFIIKSEREPVLKAPKKYHFDERTMNSSSFFSIAHLSDFHYDQHYAPNSSSDCTNFICCRNTSIPNENSTHTAGYWGDYHVCDSPGYLVENICSQVASNHKNIDLIYYTGDFADHFGWLTTKSSVQHSIEFVTKQIKEKFPNVPNVVMVIGNHDIHPSDAFAPESVDPENSSSWLYEFAADLWSEWLPESALSTLRKHGYYSFIFRPKFRIIVLNNNLCFTVNIWLLYESKEMVKQLEWLRDTLISSELNDEKVHILGHIPPNTASCVHAWNREYNKLVRQFAHIISGQFNGHTHTDEFTLLYSTDDEPVPVSVAWNGGSGTSFIGLNSNYRMYKAELNSFEVVDHETYIFNLTKANLAPGQPPIWFKEYSFRDEFDLDDLSPYTLSKLVNDTFRRDRRALYKFWTYKQKLADPQLEKGCNNECLETIRLQLNGEIDNNFHQ